MNHSIKIDSVFFDSAISNISSCVLYGQVLERVGECGEGAVERFLALCAQRGFKIEQEVVQKNLTQACEL